MSQKFNENEKEYVWHDGVRISDEQLISMARNAGSYALAEHYLCSLLAHGTMYGLTYYINKVNEVRAQYGVMPIPTPKQADDHEWNNSRHTRQSLDDQARRLYRALSQEQRKAMFKECLMILRMNYPKLFRFKNQWQGVYLVVRDRLDNGLSQSDFLSFAKSAIPKDWPARLWINENVIKNFSRDMQYDDDDEAYYEMDYNPFGLLCDTFWEILKQQI
jgi:hypothetical protein